jgi:DDE family transposase
MSHCIAGKWKRQVNLLRTQFAQKEGLPFAEVLPAERVEQVLEQEGVQSRDCVFTLPLTLWAFLSQVVSADGSCRATVARVLAWLVSRGERPCSPKTDPYCKARQRLPENLFLRLMRETGQTLHQQVPADWLWNGRRVKIADGSSVLMSDTPANQAEFPQVPGQKPGLGFPILRLVVVFCFACGTVLDAAVAPYKGKLTGETALLRSLEKCFEPGDVLLLDRYFSGYCDLAWWQVRSVDVVTRLNERRRCDMRRGTRLGRDDHIVVYPKPKIRRPWMTAEEFASLPDELRVREVRVRISVRGFRTKEVVVVTTLLDHEKYSAAALAQLYRARWLAELNLRSIKEAMGMDMLRCKSPEMVRKELWAHLLAYNLIRTVIAQAAVAHEMLPHEISFKGALQTMSAFAERLMDLNAESADRLYESLLLAIATHVVGDRPNRIEPRARKRRPKSYPLLTKPRDVARKLIGKRT